MDGFRGQFHFLVNSPSMPTLGATRMVKKSRTLSTFFTSARILLFISRPTEGGDISF